MAPPLLLEVAVYVDTEGHTQCCMTTLAPDAPAAAVVTGLLRVVRRLSGEAERMAAEAGCRIVLANGDVRVEPAEP